MPIANGRTVHTDVPLTNLAVEAFDASEEGFVSGLIAPAIPVSKQSDAYYVIDKGAFMRREDSGAKRAPGTPARRKLWSVSSDTFFCHNYALASEIPIEYLENADMAIRHRENSTLAVTHDLRLQQESRMAGLVTSISNVGSGVALTGADKWSDFVNSNPLAAVNTAQAFIRSQTGFLANTMLLDWNTEKQLRQHPLVIDRFKYTTGGEVNRSQLQEFFSVQNIVVANAIENTAAETTDSAGFTSGDVWGNVCVLMHLGPATGLQSRTPFARFQWQTSAFASNFSVTRDIQNAAGSKHVEVIEAGHYQDEKVIARDLAYTITGTL